MASATAETWGRPGRLVPLTMSILLMSVLSTTTRTSAFVPTVAVTTKPALPPHTQLFVVQDNSVSTTSSKRQGGGGGGAAHWHRLDPRVKARIMRAGQERAVANKQKRESDQTKKRRMLQFVKEQHVAKKHAQRVPRPVPFANRTALADLAVGMELNGTVISLTPFGAYVDVGTDCDGLLHISQMSETRFVTHAAQVVAPGDPIKVQVRSLSVPRQKLHLTMLPPATWQAQLRVDRRRGGGDDDDDRLPLDNFAVDDEVWGEIKRVTDYGAYVEIGAVVDGWLHFMDHTAWDYGATSHQVMQVGDKVRLWVARVDAASQRLQLTAYRPAHLPGPRREVTRR